MKFSTEEIQFVKDNISVYGIPHCCKELKRSYSSIKHIALSNNLAVKRCNRGIRGISYKYPNHLKSLLTPEAVYTAGFIWGDGHVRPEGNSTIIGIAEADGLELSSIFNVAEEWDLTLVPKQKSTWSNQTRFTNHDSDVHSLLVSMNYLNKTGEVPDLSKVPPNMLHYWYLGYSDADGCFYNNEKRSLAQYQITSCIDQDWSYIETLLTSLDINHQIDRRQTTDKDGGLHARSNIRFQGAPNVTKWGSYIYQTYGQDGIGLKRKHSAYIECFRMGRSFS